jgi:hypothetical protein
MHTGVPTLRRLVTATALQVMTDAAAAAAAATAAVADDEKSNGVAMLQTHCHGYYNAYRPGSTAAAVAVTAI